MTSIELLKEIESWLSFNTEPSKEETAKLRKSIKEHLTEQLRIHDVVGRSEQLTAFAEYCDEEHGLFIPSWMIDGYNKSSYLPTTSSGLAKLPNTKVKLKNKS